MQKLKPFVSLVAKWMKMWIIIKFFERKKNLFFFAWRILQSLHDNLLRYTLTKYREEYEGGIVTSFFIIKSLFCISMEMCIYACVMRVMTAKKKENVYEQNIRTSIDIINWLKIVSSAVVARLYLHMFNFWFNFTKILFRH